MPAATPDLRQGVLLSVPRCTIGAGRRCSRSTRPDCDCACGGANHGKAQRTVTLPHRPPRHTGALPVDATPQPSLFDPRAVVWSTRRDAVLALLMSGGWHDTMAIHAVGGTSATRRLRELRKNGQPIEKRRKHGSELYEYRLAL